MLKQINEDIAQALKKKQSHRLDVLRMLKSELQYESNKKGNAALTHEKSLALVKKSIKRRQESINCYEEAQKSSDPVQKSKGSDHFEEKIASEKLAINILSQYLPPSVPTEEIQEVVTNIIADIPVGTKDKGKIMGQVMAHFKGQNIEAAQVIHVIQEKIEDKIANT